MSNRRSVKVQFYFRPELVKLLDTLVEKTGAMSRAEVVRTAVTEYARKVINQNFQRPSFKDGG